MKKLYFLILPFLLTLGCVTEPKVDLKTPGGLYKLGRFYQEQDRFEEAIAQYKALANKHPYSKLATDAELRVADCYFEKQEFPEAFNSYKIFKELHPKHKSMDYVTYRAAKSLDEQLPSGVDRDLTKARQAMSFYQEVHSVYPTSKLAKNAKKRMFELAQMLADKELYIADFYFQQKQYLSSLTRYELFLKEFPRNKKTPHALLRAGLAAKKIDIKDKASKYKGLVIKNYPKSKEAISARKGL